MTKRIKPIHPGKYLKEILDELKLSQYQLAKELHVSAMRVSHIVKGKRPITAELAYRLGYYFSQSPRYWLNLQDRYDMDIVENEMAKRISREIHPYLLVDQIDRTPYPLNTSY